MTNTDEKAAELAASTMITYMKEAMELRADYFPSFTNRDVVSFATAMMISSQLERIEGQILGMDQTLQGIEQCLLSIDRKPTQ